MAIDSQDPNRDATLCSRNNSGKPKLSYFLEWPNAIKGFAGHCERGSVKYSRGNWKKGAQWSELIDCMLRHLTKFQNGQDMDDDPTMKGSAEVDAILWNAMTLSEMFYTRKDLDDRVSDEDKEESAQAKMNLRVMPKEVLDSIKDGTMFGRVDGLPLTDKYKLDELADEVLGGDDDDEQSMDYFEADK